MKPIYAFGELLIDALQQDSTVEDGLSIPNARLYPGGAPANAAVAAAKLGAPTFFIGQVGRDEFGAYLKRALNHYQVDTRYLRTTNAPTPLAVVSLDEHGERRFQFYRNGTADVMLPAHKLPHPREFKPGILHVCSNTLTEEGIRNVHLGFVDRCIDAGNVISFDVNLRRNLWPDQTNFHEPIKQMLTRADVIKVSREELTDLWEVDAEEALTNLVFAHRAQAIFITDGARPVVLLTREGRETLSAPSVSAVDTTAAGDAFSGAVLASLSRDEQDQPDWQAALALGVRCGAFAVGRRGAFPSLPGWDDVAE